MLKLYQVYPTQLAGGEVHDAVRDESVDEFVGRVQQLDDSRPVLYKHRPPRLDHHARPAVRRPSAGGSMVGRCRAASGRDALLLPRQIVAHHVLLVGRRQRLAQLHEIRFRSELRHVIQYGADAIGATLFALCENNAKDIVSLRHSRLTIIKSETDYGNCDKVTL